MIRGWGVEKNDVDEEKERFGSASTVPRGRVKQRGLNGNRGRY